MIIYNLSSEEFTTRNITSTDEGKLEFDLSGGGNIIGIHGGTIGNSPDIRVTDIANRDYRYFEAGKTASLDIKLVNVGNQDAENIIIKAFSKHPYISFTDAEINVPNISSSSLAKLYSQFSFSFSEYKEEYPAGHILLEISVNGVVADTQKVVFFSTPESPYAVGDDIIILDGRTQNNVSLFDQKNNSIYKRSLSGGNGNGNGVLEKEEEALVYIRIPQGMSPNDKNTFHKCFLIDNADEPNIIVNRLRYEEKSAQAAATSIFSYISVPDSATVDTLDLWFKLESLYNELNVPERDGRRGGLYEFKYDYRRIKLPLSDSAAKYSIETNITGSGSVTLTPPGGSYALGTDVTLTAIPDTGWSFNNWWGDFMGSDNPYEVEIEGNILVTATFDSIATGTTDLDINLDISNYPNPFRDWTQINYELQMEGRVIIGIYNAQGLLIKILKNEMGIPGRYTDIWDGTNHACKPCPAGIYYCMISISGNLKTQKIIKL